MPLTNHAATVFYEKLNFPSSDSTRSRLDISLRIPYNFLVFVKSDDPTHHPQFISNVEINIEVLDQRGTTVAYNHLNRQLQLDQPPTNSASQQFLERIISFHLQPDTYAVTIEVSNRESDRKFFHKDNVTLLNFFHRPITISDILFLRQSTHQDTLQIFNYGGDVPFGTNFDAYFELVVHAQSIPVRLQYHLFEIRREKETEEKILLVRDSLSYDSLRRSTAVPYTATEGKPTYLRLLSPTSNTISGIVRFSGDTLKEGRYEIELIAAAGDSVTTVNEQFNVRWFDSPSALQSLAFAIDALEYLASEDEMKLLKRAKPEYKQLVFDDFWKKRDPTPHTAFNEAQAEYYTRVDHAFTTFSTVRQQNGIKTDRGKAYVLYGAPSSINRELPSNAAPRETWLYPSLHKKLVFTDNSRVGDYKLTSTEELQ